MTIRESFAKICDIITAKANKKAKSGDFRTMEEYRTYIYEHELPFVEAMEKQGWYKENGKMVYYGEDGMIY